MTTWLITRICSTTISDFLLTLVEVEFRIASSVVRMERDTRHNDVTFTTALKGIFHLNDCAPNLAKEAYPNTHL